VAERSAWLVPQPEAHYAFIYRGVSVLARPSDMYGVGDADETPNRAPNRAEAEAALRTVSPLFV
jgi:hypothetical protein